MDSRFQILIFGRFGPMEGFRALGPDGLMPLQGNLQGEAHLRELSIRSIMALQQCIQVLNACCESILVVIRAMDPSPRLDSSSLYVITL